MPNNLENKFDYSHTITVAKDASQSEALDMGEGWAIGFCVPAALEATSYQLSFQSAPTFTGTYVTVYKGGTKLALPITASTQSMLDTLADLYGVRFLKITIETSGGVAVSQATAARIFTVVKDSRAG
jgi:hypothetical protein